MFSKKTVVISTLEGNKMKSATKGIQNTLFYWGVPYIKKIWYRSSENDLGAGFG